jgi:purine-nucleoside phosphorylase
MKVLAISVVTNMAAGILDQLIDHAEVLETGRRIRGQFSELLRRLIPKLAA